MIATTGAVLAAVGALLASPSFPIGVARRADPDPGLHIDWTVLAIVLPVLVAVVFVTAGIAAWRTAGAVSLEPTPARYPVTSGILQRAGEAGLSPSATSGLRMAIQRGRGTTAVPVRSAFAGAVFGLAGVTAALVFAASLGHLVDTPRLSGWAWDLRAEVPTHRVCADTTDYGIAEQRGIDAVALACSANISVGGRPVSAWGFRTLRGTIRPVIVSGRAPLRHTEVALGSETLKALGKKVGDTVEAHGEGPPHRYRIVGRVVLPTIDSLQPIADGAAFTGTGLLALRATGENETDYRLVRFTPHTDVVVAGRRIAALPSVTNVRRGTTPVEVTRLQKIDRIPVALAALLAVLAAIAIGHAVVTAVRLRRRELALLKTLGFTRREVGATVAWQASVLATVGLVLGIPIGLIVGRVAWRLVADSLGIATEVSTPLVALALLVPCTLLLTSLIALFPARSAARTRPAVALRSG